MRFLLLVLVMLVAVPRAEAQNEPYDPQPSLALSLAGGLGGGAVGAIGWTMLASALEHDESACDYPNVASDKWCENEPLVYLALAVAPLLAAGGALWLTGRLQDQGLAGYAVGGAVLGIVPGYLAGGVLFDDGGGLVGVVVGMGVGAALGMQAGWRSRMQVAPVLGHRKGLSLRVRL